MTAHIIALAVAIVAILVGTITYKVFNILIAISFLNPTEKAMELRREMQTQRIVSIILIGGGTAFAISQIVCIV